MSIEIEATDLPIPHVVPQSRVAHAPTHPHLQLHEMAAAVAPVLSRLGLVTVLLGTFLPMLDFFIVNVALPTVGADLHAAPSALELVVAGYGIAYALLL